MNDLSINMVALVFTYTANSLQISFKPRLHTMNSFESIASLQINHCRYFNNDFAAFQCSVTLCKETNKRIFMVSVPCFMRELCDYGLFL